MDERQECDGGGGDDAGREGNGLGPGALSGDAAAGGEDAAALRGEQSCAGKECEEGQASAEKCGCCKETGDAAHYWAAAKAGLDWLAVYAPLFRQTRRVETELGPSAKYWYTSPGAQFPEVKKSRLQLLSGGCSLVLRERRSQAQFYVLYSQYVLISFAMYTAVFELLLAYLDKELATIDSSGSLSSICSTLVLIFTFLAVGVVTLPCFVMNNITATVVETAGSLVYYILLAVGVQFLMAALDTTAFREPFRSVVLILSRIYTGLAIALGIYLLYLSKFNQRHSAYRNALSASRIYTKHRVDLFRASGRMYKKPTLSLADRAARPKPGSEAVATHLVALDKRKWESYTSLGMKGLIKSVWLPSTQVLQAADTMLEIHESVVVSMLFGLILLVLIGLQVQIIADGIFDRIDVRVQSFDAAIKQVSAMSGESASAVPGNSTTQNLVDFLERSRDMWAELRDPSYFSILIGGYLAVGWTASFIPSAGLGFKRTALELRVGIADQPGMISNSRTDDMAPYRAMFFFGAYVSCVAFAWVMSFIIFALVVLLCTWPPFFELVWSLNWLWLPSLVMIVFNMATYSLLFKKGFHFQSVGAGKVTLDLVRPRSWALIELGLTIAYFPAFLLSALMRCLYILLIAFLGVLRVDTSLFPPGAHAYDSPYLSFAALSLRTYGATSPLFRAAADMFWQVTPRPERRSLAWYRTRNRLWLAVMLINHPSLARLRCRPEPPSEEKPVSKSGGPSSPGSASNPGGPSSPGSVILPLESAGAPGEEVKLSFEAAAALV